MDTRIIRIRTRKGRQITRRAIVQEYLDPAGRVVAAARWHKTTYQVVDRDFYGPIYGAK